MLLYYEKRDSPSEIRKYCLRWDRTETSTRLRRKTMSLRLLCLCPAKSVHSLIMDNDGYLTKNLLLNKSSNLSSTCSRLAVFFIFAYSFFFWVHPSLHILTCLCHLSLCLNLNLKSLVGNLARRTSQWVIMVFSK